MRTMSGQGVVSLDNQMFKICTSERSNHQNFPKHRAFSVVSQSISQNMEFFFLTALDR